MCDASGGKYQKFHSPYKKDLLDEVNILFQEVSKTGSEDGGTVVMDQVLQKISILANSRLAEDDLSHSGPDIIGGFTLVTGTGLCDTQDGSAVNVCR